MISRLTLLLLELALLVFGVLAIFSSNLMYLATWILLALTFVVACAWRVSRSAVGVELMEPNAGLLGPLGLVFTLFVSLVGITSGLLISFNTGSPGQDSLNKLLGVPAVLLAWAILHFGYAERYASAYYSALPTKQFEFPETEQPNFADFCYFAFTVGTTFAVSDVETRTTRARSRVLSHSVLSFLYNTATLGIAIGVVTGGK